MNYMFDICLLIKKNCKKDYYVSIADGIISSNSTNYTDQLYYKIQVYVLSAKNARTLHSRHHQIHMYSAMS